MNDALPPGEFAQALQDERDAKRRRTFILWGVVATLVIVVGVGVWLAFFSSALAVKNVTVSGTSLVTEADVRTRAAVQMGVPLLRTDTEAIEQRILELPAVRSVEVTRDFPDTVSIVVEERRLVFQRARDGQYDWVDGDGIIFHRTAEPAVGAVNVISGTEEQRLLADIATVSQNIPANVLADLESLTAESVDRMTLALTDGRTVEWGSAEESELKGDVLEALLTVEASVYDVSAPRHPTTR